MQIIVSPTVSDIRSQPSINYDKHKVRIPGTINYPMIQNFGGRKLWRNSSLQKLADNILANAQIELKI